MHREAGGGGGGARYDLNDRSQFINVHPLHMFPADER